MNKNKLISLFVTFGFLGKVKYFPGTIGSFGGLLAGASIIKILGHNIFISCFFILTLISFMVSNIVKSFLAHEVGMNKIPLAQLRFLCRILIA